MSGVNLTSIECPGCGGTGRTDKPSSVSGVCSSGDLVGPFGMLGPGCDGSGIVPACADCGRRVVKENLDWTWIHLWPEDGRICRSKREASTPTKKAYMAVGVAGAGKSTFLKPFADRIGAGYVSTDGIREELFGDEGAYGVGEDEVFDTAYQRMHKHLEERGAVVVDATYTNPEYRKIALDHLWKKADEVHALWFDAPLATTLERNRGRDRKVPEDVVNKMHQQLQESPPTKEEGFTSVTRLPIDDQKVAKDNPDMMSCWHCSGSGIAIGSCPTSDGYWGGCPTCDNDPNPGEHMCPVCGGSGINNYRTASEDWRALHRPNEQGARLHDLTEADQIPDDVYTHPEYYASSSDEETQRAYDEAISVMRAVRGNPDAEVTIYRGAPEGSGIGHGDWVTTSKTYATMHGRHATDPSQDFPVHELKVRARDVRFADDLCEYGYFPAQKQAQFKPGPTRGEMSDVDETNEEALLQHLVDQHPEAVKSREDVTESGATAAEWHTGLHSDESGIDLEQPHWHATGTLSDRHKPDHEYISHLGGIAYFQTRCSCGWESNIRSEQATNHEWQNHFSKLDEKARLEKAGPPLDRSNHPVPKRHAAKESDPRDVIDDLRKTRSDVRMHEAGHDFPDAGQCGLVSEENQMKHGWKIDAGWYLDPDPQVPEMHRGFGDHVWNVTSDGTIVDATHDQFGRGNDVAILPPGHADRWRYHSYCSDDSCRYCTDPELNPDRAQEVGKTSAKEEETYYHVAYPENRESIREKGLWTSENARGKDWGGPRGRVYLHSDLEMAQDMADLQRSGDEPPHDVWEVKVDPKKVKPDPDWYVENDVAPEESYWHYHEGPIAPDKIRLVGEQQKQSSNGPLRGDYIIHDRDYFDDYNPNALAAWQHDGSSSHPLTDGFSMGTTDECESCGGAGERPCVACGGDGNSAVKDAEVSAHHCESCQGRGSLSYPPSVRNLCGTCKGSGLHIDVEKEACEGCGGSGKDECEDCSGEGVWQTDPDEIHAAVKHDNTTRLPVWHLTDDDGYEKCHHVDQMSGQQHLFTARDDDDDDDEAWEDEGPQEDDYVINDDRVSDDGNEEWNAKQQGYTPSRDSSLVFKNNLRDSLDVPHSRDCPACEGNGQNECRSCDGRGANKEKDWDECSNCKGAGVIKATPEAPGESCAWCNGSGLHFDDTCNDCLGTGFEHNKDREPVDCGMCDGKGSLPTNQEDVHGYIAKDMKKQKWYPSVWHATGLDNQPNFTVCDHHSWLGYEPPSQEKQAHGENDHEWTEYTNDGGPGPAEHNEDGQGDQHFHDHYDRDGNGWDISHGDYVIDTDQFHEDGNRVADMERSRGESLAWQHDVGSHKQFEAKAFTDCKHCDGRGEHECDKCGHSPEHEMCDNCRGTGITVGAGYHECGHCLGEGVVPAEPPECHVCDGASQLPSTIDDVHEQIWEDQHDKGEFSSVWHAKNLDSSYSDVKFCPESEADDYKEWETKFHSKLPDDRPCDKCGYSKQPKKQKPKTAETNVSGTVYLLHFERPISDVPRSVDPETGKITGHTTQHYIGWAGSEGLDARIERHRRGEGARLTQVAKEKGIGFDVVRTWENVERSFERTLKNRKYAPRICPTCTGKKAAIESRVCLCGHGMYVHDYGPNADECHSVCGCSYFRPSERHYETCTQCGGNGSLESASDEPYHCGICGGSGVEMRYSKRRRAMGESPVCVCGHIMPAHDYGPNEDGCHPDCGCKSFDAANKHYETCSGCGGNGTGHAKSVGEHLCGVCGGSGVEMRYGSWVDQVSAPYQEDAIAEPKDGVEPEMPPQYDPAFQERDWKDVKTVKPVDVFSNPKTGARKTAVLYIRDHGSKTFHVFDEESKEIECGHPMPPEHSGEEIWVDKPHGDLICPDCQKLHRNRWADEMAAFDAFDRRQPKTAEVVRYCVDCKKPFSVSEAGEATGFCESCRESQGMVTHHTWSEESQKGHYGSAYCEFDDLDDLSKKSLMTYYTGKSGRATDIPDPEAHARSYEYRLEHVPTEEMKQRVMDRALSHEGLGWDTYHNDFKKGIELPKHSERWPTLRWEGGPDDDEDYLEDGWHRFHSYVDAGDATIPVLHARPKGKEGSAGKQAYVDCKTCGGTGRDTFPLHPRETCDTCNGSGLLDAYVSGGYCYRPVNGYVCDGHLSEEKTEDGQRKTTCDECGTVEVHGPMYNEHGERCPLCKSSDETYDGKGNVSCNNCTWMGRSRKGITATLWKEPGKYYDCDYCVGTGLKDWENEDPEAGMCPNCKGAGIEQYWPSDRVVDEKGVTHFKKHDPKKASAEYERCGFCGATGRERCGDCGGEGYQGSEVCNWCEGSGTEDYACTECKGSGLEKFTALESEKIDYPKNWDPNTADIGKWQHGTMPTSAVRQIATYYEPHLQTNRFHQHDWDHFKMDIAENGIKEPLLLMVNDKRDTGRPRIQLEGHHRLLAAHELGMKEVPVEVRYFGSTHADGRDLFDEFGLRTAAQELYYRACGDCGGTGEGVATWKEDNRCRECKGTGLEPHVRCEVCKAVPTEWNPWSAVDPSDPNYNSYHYGNPPPGGWVHLDTNPSGWFCKDHHPFAHHPGFAWNENANIS